MVSDGRTGPIAIRGIDVAHSSKIPVRLELRDMRKNYPDHWNLFLLGMESFKGVKEDDPMSFYQIAGIHGLPYDKPWPSEKWNHELAAQPRGYCTHTSILFLPWHRPYLSLFEMALFKHVNAIASEFKESENRDRYIKAAKEFRLPYWDWARPTDKDVTLFPWEVTSTAQFKVYRPKGGPEAQLMTENPLATYAFQEGGEGRKDTDIDQYQKTHKTLRYPDKNEESVDWNVSSKLSKIFENGGEFQKNRKGMNLTERTLFILKAYEEFPPMSSNKIPGGKQSKWNGWGSLEDIHNSVHGYVGGGGHMSYPETAAFDPVFWLHHCNIDRLFAIWQALHDNGEERDYVVPTDTKEGTRTIPQYTKNPNTGKQELTQETITTPLAPFTKSDKPGDYWTAEGVRKTETFGYTYSEIVSKNKDDIYQKLDKVYYGGSLATIASGSGSVNEQLMTEFQARAATHQVVSQAAEFKVPLLTKQARQAPQISLAATELTKLESIKIELPKDRSPNDLIVDGKYFEWLVDVRASKYANGGDFLVHFFLGAPEDEQPNLYIFNSNHVAAFNTFGRGAEAGCVKCQTDRDQGLVVAGQIPLTIGLVERYMAGPAPASLGIDDIEDYLARNLHWRVTTHNGRPLPRDSIQDLLVGVVTNEVTLPTNPSGRPVYAPDVIPRPRATTNEQGTAGRGNGTGFTGEPL